MPLTHSLNAPPFLPEQLAGDLRALFPSGTLAPFDPLIRLSELEITTPFAVYTPATAGLRASEILYAAELNRWCSMLVHRAAVVAWAWLRKDDAHGRLRMVEVSVNGIRERVVAAIRLAEGSDEVAAGTYELRFVESPVHAFFAVWLAPWEEGQRHLVLPVTEHHWELRAGAIYDLDTVSRALAATEDDESCAAED